MAHFFIGSQWPFHYPYTSLVGGALEAGKPAGSFSMIRRVKKPYLGNTTATWPLSAAGLSLDDKLPNCPEIIGDKCNIMYRAITKKESKRAKDISPISTRIQINCALEFFKGHTFNGYSWWSQKEIERSIQRLNDLKIILC